MSRFTKKSNSILKEIEYQLIDEKENLSANEEIKKIQVLGTNKLGKLEDIEEELGIDLITLFKALRNGIWTNQEQCYGDEKQGKIRFFQVRLLLEENAVGCIHNSMWKGKEVIRTLYFKDYGKTWALTKEELENDN